VICRAASASTGEKLKDGFTKTYDVTRLVWFAAAIAAIQREKQIKKWRWGWKVRLIEEDNPDRSDLYPTLVAQL
jgi:putative endonuclease